jgi:hypothetical protein
VLAGMQIVKFSGRMESNCLSVITIVDRVCTDEFV